MQEAGQFSILNISNIKQKKVPAKECRDTKFEVTSQVELVADTTGLSRISFPPIGEEYLEPRFD